MCQTKQCQIPRKSVIFGGPVAVTRPVVTSHICGRSHCGVGLQHAARGFRRFAAWFLVSDIFFVTFRKSLFASISCRFSYKFFVQNQFLAGKMMSGGYKPSGQLNERSQRSVFGKYSIFQWKIKKFEIFLTFEGRKDTKILRTVKIEFIFK